MATAARIAAQGKINLGLRVLAREAGGYHQLETVFARLALADIIEVRITDGERKLDVKGGDTGPLDKNLALRGALAFISATGWPPGFSISLQKNIPIGAGLGGGSADAGGVLRALNALAPHRATRTPRPCSRGTRAVRVRRAAAGAAEVGAVAPRVPTRARAPRCS